MKRSSRSAGAPKASRDGSQRPSSTTATSDAEAKSAHGSHGTDGESERSRGGRGGRRSGGLPDAIIGALVERGVPVALEQLFDDLDAAEARHRRAIVRRLESMERAGQVVRNRREEYGLARKMDLVPGRVQAHRDGYGFLLPEAGGDDLFLSPPQMRAVMHGDRVMARVVGIDARGRREGAVVEVLERGTTQIVGRYWRESGAAFVRPDHVRMHQDVLVPKGDELNASHGEMVVAEISEPPTKHHPPVGKVIEVLGDRLAPGMEIDIALRAYEIPEAFSDAALKQAARFGSNVAKRMHAGREDLRELPLVTIDGLDARDFDDAVHCAPTPKGWRLTVAIADVSSYVVPGSALDIDASARGTSVYFPERVVPMLPETLSNGLCSLRPEEDRLGLVCEVLIARDGKVRRSRFFNAVMRSHARLTYDEVAKVLVDQDPIARTRLASLVPHLEALHELYLALFAARVARGALDFDSSESRLVFDRDGKVSEIVAVMRNDAHRLIEECMITANVAAARFLARHRMTALYRIHDGPNADKLSDLRAMLEELGLVLGGGADPQPLDYAELIEQIKGNPESPVVQVALLRSLTQAVYAPTNSGHFGLALEQYMHFTSPIRRYPDLLVHRAIKQVLRGGPRDIYPYDAAELASLGERCSMTERRAEDATRDVVFRLKSEYLQARVGQSFAGVVSGVAPFGLFVTLAGLDISGLVHVSALGSDYFHYDPVTHRLTGERSGTVHKVGDPLLVQVTRVDVDDRKIDLELVDCPSAGSPQRGREGGGASEGGRRRTTGRRDAPGHPGKQPGTRRRRGGSR